MASWKSQFFRYGLSALWFSGLARAFTPLTAGRGAIFMLHRVLPELPLHDSFAPNSNLAITPGYLDALLDSFRASDIDIVGLDEAQQRLRAAASTRRFVCFTLDDGYRDNLLHALPVFRRHGAPFTIYVTSGFIDRTHAPWWDVLEHVLRVRARVRWFDEHGDRDFETADALAKQRTFDAFAQRFMAMRAVELRPLLQRFAHDNEFDLTALTAREFCDWDEVRALRAAGAEIGCHTQSHSALALENMLEVRRELSESRLRIEQELGVEVAHFAYPYGKPEQTGAREFSLARELGFRSATTTRKGALFAAHADYPHALPRIELTPSFAGATRYVHTIARGLPLLAWNRGRRVVVN
jgi:peptidoglycan/xylan/chitin deacetylase (PgdA/CDA1 family)